MLKAVAYKDLSDKIFASEPKGKLPNDALNFIYSNKLFKFFVPGEFGGLGLTLPDSLKLLTEVSKIDGNLGWLLSTGSGASYFYGFMQPAIAEEVFSAPNAVIAGSGHPSGIATAVAGGYKINGAWKYCSGAEIATSFTFNCKIGNSDEILAFIFKPSHVTIKHDWDGFGLKTTCSHTVVIENVFIPHKYTFNITKPPVHDDLIYKLPFLPFAQASIATAGMGIAEKLLHASNLLTENNSKQWQPDRYSYVKNKMEILSSQLSRAKDDLLQQAALGWDLLVANQLDNDWSDRVDSMSKSLSRSSLKVGTELIPYLGMAAIKEHNYINYLWRNLQTASQHVLITPFEDIDRSVN